jgi:spermidine synthase
MKNNLIFYKITAFVGGLTIMAVEITATRIMGPYFGTSIFIWTNILGVIMSALAIGYWGGGKIADRYPQPKTFFLILAITALLILTIPFYTPPLLDAISDKIATPSASLVIYSLLACLLIFFIPFSLMGMISPYLIRLSNRHVEKTGTVAGSIFALSTVGSIVGTFLPTLVTVPLMGVERTIVVFGAILCLVAAIGLGKARLFILLLIVAVGGFIIGPKIVSHPEVIAATDSPYSYIEVRRYDNRTILAFSKKFAIQSLQKDEGYLTDGYYWDYFNILPEIYCDQECRVAIIGVAGGTIARQYDHFYAATKDLRIDGIEIDPAVTTIAAQYFDYAIPTLTTHHQDGRLWLRQNDIKYDIIILDAYQEVEIPAHLTSREFFQLAQTRLKPNGVLAINIGVPNPQASQFQRFLATLQKDFDYIWDLDIPATANRIVLASNSQPNLADALRQARPNPVLSQYFAYASVNIKQADSTATKLITDDLPLTEMLYDFMLYQGYSPN